MNGLRPRSGFGFASCLAPCLHVLHPISCALIFWSQYTINEINSQLQMYSFHKIGTINENAHRVLIHESDCDIIINWVGLTQPEITVSDCAFCFLTVILACR